MAALPLVLRPGGGLGQGLQTSQRRQPVIFTPLGAGCALIGCLVGVPGRPCSPPSLPSHPHQWPPTRTVDLPPRPPPSALLARLGPPQAGMAMESVLPL